MSRDYFAYGACDLVRRDGSRRKCDVPSCPEIAQFAWGACAKLSTSYVCADHDLAINAAVLSIVTPGTAKRHLSGYRRRQITMMERVEERVAGVLRE